jgi:ceramide glucosyltransferase
MSPAGWAGALCGLLAAINLLSLVVAAGRLRLRRSALQAAFNAPPVSIVRPLCGMESFSEETLRAGFALDYPDYELIFCVADPTDPIIPLVEAIVAEHPARPARIMLGQVRISDNPKLNNCVMGWEAAQHDWVVLADSNVLMPADYVQRMFAAWRADTGLVCSPPVGSRPHGFWAEVECAFLNNLQARWQYAGEAIGLGFAQGKSLLWHRPFLDARGGIRALAAEIAEDAAATKLVRAAGLNVHLVDAPFEQPLGRRSFYEVWTRQFRWARLRRVTFPVFFAPEIVSGALPLLIVGAVAAQASGWSVLATVAALALLWYGPEALLARRMRWHLDWRAPLASATRDLLLPIMWVAAWIARDVIWRGNAMSITTSASPLDLSDRAPEMLRKT